MDKFTYTPSFYVAHTPQEPLTWRQYAHNIGAELLHFPRLHKHYDLIDAKTFERSRVTSTLHAKKVCALIIKVLLAVTIVIPLVCLALYRPTANQQSSHQIATLFNQLDNEQKKDFLYDFLTHKEIEQDTPFVKLHAISESYRKSGLEADLMAQLTSLDPLAFEEVKYWGEASSTLFTDVSRSCAAAKPHLFKLYPFLAAADQIRILQQLQAKTREKDVLKLFSLSKTAALAYPGQLLQCLMPRYLTLGDYGVTLGGHPALSPTSEGLQRKLPKAYLSVVEVLLETMPQPSVLGIFWKIAKGIRPGIWEQHRIHCTVTTKNLSPEEQALVKALPFEEVLVLYQFTQPWTQLWYQVGQTSEALRQACFSLPHEKYNSSLEEENRKKFLDFLSHEDLKDLISADAECVELAKIFGTEWTFDSRYNLADKLPLNSRRDQVEIPRALMRWWQLYQKVDYLKRFSELQTFCTHPALLQYFQADHANYIKMKPELDAAIKDFQEHMDFARKQIAQGHYHTSLDDMANWRRAKQAKLEQEQERARAKQELLATCKLALEYIGLKPKERAYTQHEVVREFRRWSVLHHPDKDQTDGATARFQQGNAYKEQVVALFENYGYSCTPIFQ